MRNLLNKVDSARSTEQMSLNDTSYLASSLPPEYPRILGNPRYEREHIVVDPDFWTLTNTPRRSNLRIRNIITGAEAVVTAIHSAKQTNLTSVYLGPDGWNRLGVPTYTEPVPVLLSPFVAHPTKTIQEAIDTGDVIERLNDPDPQQNTMIVLSPHGGEIERWTSDQSQRFFDQINGDITRWDVQGYTLPGSPENTFNTWHITSVDISPDSFPLVKSVIDRDFQYALSFHGFSRDTIEVGGSAPQAFLDQIVAVIQSVVPPEISVFTTNDPLIAGSAPRNITNRLSPNLQTVQVEQSWEARELYGTAIADALAQFYSDLLFPA